MNVGVGDMVTINPGANCSLALWRRSVRVTELLPNHQGKGRDAVRVFVPMLHDTIWLWESEITLNRKPEKSESEMTDEDFIAAAVAHDFAASPAAFKKAAEEYDTEDDDA